MKIRYGLVLTIAIGLGLTGCASGGGGSSTAVGGSGGALVAGENPRNSDNTRTAGDALDAAFDSDDPAEARAFFEQALTSSTAAITEDERNPLAHRMAAMAALGLEDYQAAGAHFDRAVELRPLYDFDLAPVRERAWIDLYQAATPFTQSGDYETAAVYYENANAIHKARPEAMVTLAQIYAQLRQYDQSIASIDEALAFIDGELVAEVDSATAQGWRDQIAELPLLKAQVLTDAGRFEEAEALFSAMTAEDPTNVVYKRSHASLLLQMGNQAASFAVFDDLLAMPGLSGEDYFSVGIGFYQGSEYTRAADAFRGAAGLSVNDRDALEMWARSLQLDSAYTDIPPIAERWSELDPASQNALLILAQAANQNGDQAATQAAIAATEALDINVNDLQLQRFANGGAQITGSVVNKKLSQGASVTLRFTFYSNEGTPIGSVTETVSLGATDMAEVFRIEFDSAETVGGYGYEVG